MTGMTQVRIRCVYRISRSASPGSCAGTEPMPVSFLTWQIAYLSNSIIYRYNWNSNKFKFNKNFLMSFFLNHLREEVLINTIKINEIM